jgi:hypothetical protein
MPFLYVLLFWFLRHRPIWLGTVAAIGFLNREFSIYGLPMLLLVDLKDRRLFNTDGIRRWVLVGVASLAVLQTVQALKPYADYYGPGTRGQLLRGFDESQAGNLRQRMTLDPSALPRRAAAMLIEHAPKLLGARPFDDGFGLRGHPALRWPLLVALAAIGVRVAFLALGRPLSVPPIGLYLTGVGVLAAAVYVLTRPADTPVDRYFVLVLFVPTGLTALHLAVEPLRAVRWAVIGGVLCWSAYSAADHAALAMRFFGEPPAHELRDVIDALRRRDVRVAEAGYWRAYKLTFLAREEVKIAATDFARIDEYQQLANAAGPSLVSIREHPCPGGQVVGAYYLCEADGP